MQDPIADMLTRIRNAQQIKKAEVTMPQSKQKANIAEVLKEEGYIKDYEVYEEGKKAYLKIKLRYYENQPVIDQLIRVSKPGRRVYRGKDELPQVESGLGTVIVSTSKGVMSDHKARQKSCGGEILCYVS